MTSLSRTCGTESLHLSGFTSFDDATASDIGVPWQEYFFLTGEHSALRADSEHINPFLRDRLVAQLMHTCRV